MCKIPPRCYGWPGIPPNGDNHRPEPDGVTPMPKGQGYVGPVPELVGSPVLKSCGTPSVRLHKSSLAGEDASSLARADMSSSLARIEDMSASRKKEKTCILVQENMTSHSPSGSGHVTT